MRTIEPVPSLACAVWLRAAESQRIMATLATSGVRSRFVGGCVRDTLLNPSLDEVDIDVATQARPEVVMALLDDAGIKQVPTGIAHGTVTAFLGKRSYEITTLREDVACDGRRAEVSFTNDFVADAARRDFTINTLGCDIKGVLYDPFAGLADLLEGRVRFVGDPERRITEDYLRILRFFRFHARFAKGAFDPLALGACLRLQDGLDGLSAERKRQELFRLLSLDNAAASLEAMQAGGLLFRVIETRGDLERFTRLRERAPWADALLGLAALARGSAGTASSLSRRLRLSRVEEARLGQLLERPLPRLDADAAAHRRRAFRLGMGLYRELLALKAAETEGGGGLLARSTAALDDFNPPPFPVKGHDLLAQGYAGPELGRRLEALRDYWVSKDFKPGRDELLGLVAAPPTGAAADDGSPRLAQGPLDM